ncbi:hypothetical protein EU513_01440 [Yimella sp. RIT 621]|uniref:hypothetical protein n=1 Tax=Yimella sp. RIT 621 TaxID=2510323 RepID=UPI00101C9C30|nr:hypothetical protein EU513_01440 [Yimella sp. RIT 621]
MCCDDGHDTSSPTAPERCAPRNCCRQEACAVSVPSSRHHTARCGTTTRSAPTVDLIQRTAVESGAIAARMTGGGFGESVIATVEKGRGPTVLARCAEASRLAGHPTPTAFVASAGDGARRLD